MKIDMSKYKLSRRRIGMRFYWSVIHIPTGKSIEVCGIEWKPKPRLFRMYANILRHRL